MLVILSELEESRGALSDGQNHKCGVDEIHLEQGTRSLPIRCATQYTVICQFEASTIVHVAFVIEI